MLTEFTHFGPNMGMKTGVFYEKLDENDMKHRVFERMDVFSTKYGHESFMF